MADYAKKASLPFDGLCPFLESLDVGLAKELYEHITVQMAEVCVPAWLSCVTSLQDETFRDSLRRPRVARPCSMPACSCSSCALCTVQRLVQVRLLTHGNVYHLVYLNNTYVLQRK